MNTDLFIRERRALARARAYRDAVAARVSIDDQIAAHGFAWIATLVAALEALLAWGERSNRGEARDVVTLGFGEYLAQLCGGVPLSQSEYARPGDFGLAPDWLARDPAVAEAIARADAGLRARIGQGLDPDLAGDDPDDAVLVEVARSFRRFAAARVDPRAHEWHRDDGLIPIEIIAELGALGAFGMTVAEEHGGQGLGKRAMALVTQALSAASLGVGSLATRTEIAAELIAAGGTEDQKRRYLPGIASGAIIPTAVFTEPGAGSDLASLSTRAVRDGDVYRITGSKIWITHGARADLMTLMARTGGPGARGLSMFLADKPRGTDADPFPVAGLRGGEIPVIGYRGMKEYEIAFDGFAVPVSGLLGGRENEGFRQLMASFESARIQTAARGVGVAEAATRLAFDYARTRRQFGKALIEFPRIAGKLAIMATETVIARELTGFAARAKDGGKRCDIEAGMAKLLAARIAWANADACVQIHGGSGYASEHAASRLLLDARILSIFEGTAEIQAQVIAKGLLK